MISCLLRFRLCVDAEIDCCRLQIYLNITNYTLQRPPLESYPGMVNEIETDSLVLMGKSLGNRNYGAFFRYSPDPKRELIS